MNIRISKPNPAMFWGRKHTDVWQVGSSQNVAWESTDTVYHVNHVSTSVEAEKAFDKMYYSFIIKALKLGIERNFFNLMKGICQK